jgi:hypothetical protein
VVEVLALDRKFRDISIKVLVEGVRHCPPSLASFRNVAASWLPIARI